MLDTRASAFVRKRLQDVSLIETPMHKHCRVCVVVPIYREPVHRVVNLLVSLARQQVLSEGDIEVLCVVNNGPDDGTNAWKAVKQSNALVMDLPLWRNSDGFGSHLRFPTEVLEACSEVRSVFPVYAINEPELATGTVGEARNRGLAEAAVRFDRQGKNGLVIFLDADVVIDDPNYLSQALRLFEQDKEIVAVSGGVKLVFDPDTRDETERLRLDALVERFLRRRRYQFLERFRQGEATRLMPSDAFVGQHILARSADAAAWQGFPDWKSGEDTEFGNRAKQYAMQEGKRVIDKKVELTVVNAIRDSDRTGASLKWKLEEEASLTPVSEESYARLESLVAASDEGRALVDHIDEVARIVWDDRQKV